MRHDDPNLIVMPSLSAPIDEGRLIPYPPRSRWDKLLAMIVIAMVAGVVLTFAFLRATAFH